MFSHSLKSEIGFLAFASVTDLNRNILIKGRPELEAYIDIDIYASALTA